MAAVPVAQTAGVAALVNKRQQADTMEIHLAFPSTLQISSALVCLMTRCRQPARSTHLAQRLAVMLAASR